MSVIKTNQFMMYVTKVAVCSQIHTKHKYIVGRRYEGWNFNFSNTPLDWIQELLE